MNWRTAGPRIGTAAAVLAVALLGTGSSRGADTPRHPAAAPGQAAPAAAQAEECDTTASLPPRKDERSETIARIRANGALRVGVDQNSYNWGYRDPLTGQIQGFDIDLARAIAKSIFGDEKKLVLKAVPTARRIEAVKAGEVDMIVRTMTITCERMREVAFSKPYFKVSQSLVVPVSAPGKRDEGTVAEHLRGKRVCAADKSSSSVELANGRHGTAEVKIVENQLDCLVLMQIGRIDATLADTVLAYAQVAQDPMVKIVGQPIVPAFMGIAMNQNKPDLVAWVNQVLIDYRRDGWVKAYETWLGKSMTADYAQWMP